MKGLSTIACWLVIIGALNWGLIAIGYWMGSNWNVVELVLGNWEGVENLVYLLVGLAALVHMKDCRPSSSSSMM